MRKYFVVLAALAMVFAGCKHEDSEYTSIFFKEKSLELAIGETQKLSVRWEPTSITTAPKCEWASSDEAIVSVDQNGNIQALAVGEANITAKSGELTAVCQVTVKTIQDALQWAGWTIWNWDDETPLSDTVEIKISIGMVKAVTYPATAYVWDQYITPTYATENGQTYMDGLSGAGFCLKINNMPLYIIAEGDYKGYYIGSDYLSIVDADQFNPTDTAFAYCAAAGKRGDAQKFYDYLTNEESTVEYSECFTGTELSYIDWDAQKGYYWFGLSGEGIFAGDESEVYYRSQVDWFDNQTGLEFTEDGENPKEPGIWCNSKVYNYEKLPEQSAKRLRPMKPIQRAMPIMEKKSAKEAMNVLFNK